MPLAEVTQYSKQLSFPTFIYHLVRCCFLCLEVDQKENRSINENQGIKIILFVARINIHIRFARFGVDLDSESAYKKCLHCDYINI